MTAPRTIGFVDYNLEGFHPNTYLKLLREDLADRGFTVAGCTGMLEKEGREWAAKNDVPYFDDVTVLNAAVDCYVVLAPSNPEVHWKLCKQVFPFGKPTYVDKTFAPDLATAKRIFALADKHGVPMQTTSALRYTNVQQRVAELGADKVRHMVTWGGGRSFDEYAIHPLELAVSCMGHKIKSVMLRRSGAQSQLLLDFTRGRTAVINVYTGGNTPFAAAVTTDESTEYLAVDSGAIFRDTATAFLDLFESGEPGIDRRESLVIRRVLDLAEKKKTLKGFTAL